MSALDRQLPVTTEFSFVLNVRSAVDARVAGLPLADRPGPTVKRKRNGGGCHEPVRWPCLDSMQLAEGQEKEAFNASAASCSFPRLYEHEGQYLQPNHRQ